MNHKVLDTLEFYKILSMLEDLAYSIPGKKLCRELTPDTNPDAIRKAQQETSDALTRISRHGILPFDGIYDIVESLMRLELGASLNAIELLKISSLLTVTLRVKKFLGKDDDKVDNLNEMYEVLKPLMNLKNEIDQAIISEDEISDTASNNLKNIRRQIKLTGERIHSQLSSLVNSQSGKTFLQSSPITMRDGRYCVPVKAEYRTEIAGIIHDQSSSGSTVFIEPAFVVELNNQLRQLETEEANEIQVILAHLSVVCSQYITELHTNMETLVTLDFIFAKATLAKKMKATMPELNDDKYIEIKQGRHPLLKSEKVVPLDIRLGKDFVLLIITGPNTGGKTVSLKTVGLLTLMGQAGLHIPALDGSKLAIFQEVFADIGDEQSIEQNLSTFSSHMINTVHILKHSTPESLVLFDEPGAGTDPTEGAALGISILSFLKNKGIRTMATTHYSELKLFALSTQDVENASCEFDINTLKPTYRLLIGIPGKSNAFAISEKLGLPKHIIDNAKERINSDDRHFEDIVSQIEKQRIELEKDRKMISVYKAQIESLKNEYEKRTIRLEEQRNQIITKAKDEAYTILKEAKNTADMAIKMIQQSKRSGNMKVMEQSRQDIGSKLKENQNTSDIKAHTSKKQYTASDFEPGTGVKVLSMHLNGIVLSPPNKKGILTVNMGSFNSRVSITDLEILDEPGTTSSDHTINTTPTNRMNYSLHIKTELNVIGKTVDEAIALLEKYLDDAYLARLPQVCIIHGKGTGALRSAIHKYLKTCSYVKSYRTGEPAEGGSGATVVIFQ